MSVHRASDSLPLQNQKFMGIQVLMRQSSQLDTQAINDVVLK
jgi:hypothetical protein